MRIPVVVIGAGHAGLSVSRVLTEHGVDHVVLERGEVANTWRTQRWDSLRLLTPNWQTKLPGLDYDGDDPDGYLTVPELIAHIERYASLLDAPIETHTIVESVSRSDDGYRVVADRTTWECDAVVLATGGYNLAKVPDVAAGLPPSVNQLSAIDYKNPDQIGSGRVLVVGASASGIQIADDIERSGREVTLAVGEHVRLPRTYRDLDIMWWMDMIGRLNERYDEVDDLVRARHVPSPQLVGSPDRSTLDLNTLSERGVRLVGRIAAVSDGRAYFSGSLRNVCRLADLKLNRLLDEIDEWALLEGIDSELVPPRRPEPTAVDDDPALEIDLEAHGFESVVWATGFRPDYSWLNVACFDRKGEVRHDGGVVTDSPGLYRIGLNFLRRRKSSFIYGAEDDARDLVEHLAGHLTRSGQLTRTG